LEVLITTFRLKLPIFTPLSTIDYEQKDGKRKSVCIEPIMAICQIADKKVPR